MEMRLFSYRTNLWAYDRFLGEKKGNGITLLARNKKEALEFAKDFKGMKVFDRIERGTYDYGIDFMERQKTLLKKYLDEKSVVMIDDEVEESN